MKLHTAFLLAVFQAGWAAGEAKPNKAAFLPEELGQPAVIEANLGGRRARFIAEVAPLEIVGDSVDWIRARTSPRNGCQWRVVRKYDSDPIGLEIAGFQIYDPQVQGNFNELSAGENIPWVQSITVGDAMVWALFTRDVFQNQEFRLFRTGMDVPGRKPSEKNDYSKPRPGLEPWFKERMSTQYVDVYLDLLWQQKLFEYYKGAFRISAYKDGTLEFRCPVLPDTTEVRKRERRDYLQDYEDVRKQKQADPDEIVRDPGRSLHEEELILRYRVKEKRWEMTVPVGNFPVPYDMDAELMYLSSEREKEVIEKRIKYRRREGILPENPWLRTRPPENRR